MSRWPHTPFDSPDDARVSIAGQGTHLDPIFDQAVVEFAMTVRQGAGALTLSSGYPALPLAPGVTMATYVTYYSLGDAPVTLYQAGQLDRALTLPMAH